VKEAVELATLGLVKPIRDLVFQLEFNSLAHLVQKMTIYEQRHPELYQDKFKRQVVMVDAEDSEDSEDDPEIVVVEWARGAKPVPCKWVKQQGPLKGFDFDVSRVEQIFDLLLKEKQLKFPEGFKILTAQELQGRSYCKWHNSFTHGTNDCKELRRQIQSAIEQGRLILGQYAMKVDTQPFPNVNMVEGTTDQRVVSWISRLVSTWQGMHHVSIQGKRLVPAIGPKKKKEAISPKNRSGMSGINGWFLLIS
jgi:hypothetical protein